MATFFKVVDSAFTSVAGVQLCFAQLYVGHRRKGRIGPTARFRGVFSAFGRKIGGGVCRQIFDLGLYVCGNLSGAQTKMPGRKVATDVKARFGFSSNCANVLNLARWLFEVLRLWPPVMSGNLIGFPRSAKPTAGHRRKGRNRPLADLGAPFRFTGLPTFRVA